MPLLLIYLHVKPCEGKSGLQPHNIVLYLEKNILKLLYYTRITNVDEFNVEIKEKIPF